MHKKLVSYSDQRDQVSDTEDTMLNGGYAKTASQTECKEGFEKLMSLKQLQPFKGITELALNYDNFQHDKKPEEKMNLEEDMDKNIGHQKQEHRLQCKLNMSGERGKVKKNVLLSKIKECDRSIILNQRITGKESERIEKIKKVFEKEKALKEKLVEKTEKSLSSVQLKLRQTEEETCQLQKLLNTERSEADKFKKLDTTLRKKLDRKENEKNILEQSNQGMRKALREIRQELGKVKMENHELVKTLKKEHEVTAYLQRKLENGWCANEAVLRECQVARKHIQDQIKFLELEKSKVKLKSKAEEIEALQTLKLYVGNNLVNGKSQTKSNVKAPKDKSSCRHIQEKNSIIEGSLLEMLSEDEDDYFLLNHDDSQAKMIITEEENEKLKKEIKKKDGNLVFYLDIIEKMKNQIKCSKEEVTELKKDIESKKVDFLLYLKAFNNVKTLLDHSLGENQKRKEENESKNKDLELFYVSAEDMAVKIKTLLAERKRLKEVIESKNSDLLSYVYTLEKMETKIIKFQKEKENVKDEMRKCKQQLKGLTIKHRNCKSSLSKMQAECTNIANSNTSLRKLLANEQSKVKHYEKMKYEKDIIEKRVQEKDNETISYQKMINDICMERDKLETTQQEVKTLEKELSATTAKWKVPQTHCLLSREEIYLDGKGELKMFEEPQKTNFCKLILSSVDNQKGEVANGIFCLDGCLDRVKIENKLTTVKAMEEKETGNTDNDVNALKNDFHMQANATEDREFQWRMRIQILEKENMLLKEEIEIKHKLIKELNEIVMLQKHHSLNFLEDKLSQFNTEAQCSFQNIEKKMKVFKEDNKSKKRGFDNNLFYAKPKNINSEKEILKEIVSINREFLYFYALKDMEMKKTGFEEKNQTVKDRDNKVICEKTMGEPSVCAGKINQVNCNYEHLEECGKQIVEYILSDCQTQQYSCGQDDAMVKSIFENWNERLKREIALQNGNFILLFYAVRSMAKTINVIAKEKERLATEIRRKDLLLEELTSEHEMCEEKQKMINDEHSKVIEHLRDLLCRQKNKLDSVLGLSALSKAF